MNRSVFAFGFLMLVLVLSLSGCDGEDPAGTGDGSFRHPVVVMETTMGAMEIELYMDRAPMTVMNFLRYVEEDFYDGLIFHRVIRGFIIQGGGYDEHFTLMPTRDPIRNEADNGLSNIKGTIAMARTYVVDSATSQFFINTVNNTVLDHRDDTQMGYGYCVFGAVIEGMEILEAISRVETTTVGDFMDVPVEPVIIRVYRKK